jgi:hypothetical protein
MPIPPTVSQGHIEMALQLTGLAQPKKQGETIRNKVFEERFSSPSSQVCLSLGKFTA